MLTGENGILTQAQRAKKETEQARIDEEEALDTYNDKINEVLGIPIPPEKDENGFLIETSTINGAPGTAMNPTIPEGFKPINENEANWGDGVLAPTEESVNNGLVIEDRNGNQFVWVPVTGNYQRNTNYSSNSGNTDILVKTYITDTGYLPEGIQPKTDDATNNENAEREAVISKGGFYISRYEAGNDGSNNLISKKGATVWNYISQADCKTEAKDFINNKSVKSALCSGIQWDMTMKFVNNKLDGTNNTFDVTTSGNRHTGLEETSGQNEADRVCNIYDLEGNYWEYIAEMGSYDTGYTFVNRGGNYVVSSPASIRNNFGGVASGSYSFRFVLYVM